MSEESGIEAEKDSQALPDVLLRLLHDVESLLLQEIDLAKAEIAANAGRLFSGSFMLLFGGIVAAIGGGALIAAIITLLAKVFDLWIACALVGGIFAIAGALLAIAGRRQLRDVDFVPTRTMRSFRQTADWLRGEFR